MSNTQLQVSSFTERVLGAATQGAAASVVAAGLSAVTEPVVNRVLVQRISLLEAIQQVDMDTISKFFNTTLTTNFIKFPFFEIVSMMLADANIPFKGAALGAVFTTTTLPITNYRYCKSVGQPIDFGSLYKAYLPTVLRDIVYGTTRNLVYQGLLSKYPSLSQSPKGRFIIMFITVFASCVISAPGNELRGYFLQPAETRIPVKDFFKPDRFVRSTAIGSVIMSTALGVGTLVTEPASDLFTKLREYLNKNPLAKILIVIAVANHVMSKRRHEELLEQLRSKTKAQDSK